MATYTIPIFNSQSISTQSFTKSNFEIGAGTYGTLTFDNIARSGYTPIGVASIAITNVSSGGNFQFTIVEHSELTSTSASFRIRNVASGVAKINCTILILYLSN